jgi:hypothetical protein
VAHGADHEAAAEQSDKAGAGKIRFLKNAFITSAKRGGRGDQAFKVVQAAELARRLSCTGSI